MKNAFWQPRIRSGVLFSAVFSTTLCEKHPLRTGCQPSVLSVFCNCSLLYFMTFILFDTILGRMLDQTEQTQISLIRVHSVYQQFTTSLDMKNGPNSVQGHSIMVSKNYRILLPIFCFNVLSFLLPLIQEGRL